MKDWSESLLKTDLTVAAVLVGFTIATFVFRDSLGIVIFAVIGLATLVQLLRVAFGTRARGETLKKLWAALKDAFWGIG